MVQICMPDMLIYIDRGVADTVTLAKDAQRLRVNRVHLIIRKNTTQLYEVPGCNWDTSRDPWPR